MPINILMPALSPTMEQGNLAKWLKKEGDAVEAGEVIAEIETDKATMEVEAVDEGVIGKILVPAGSKEVSVNSPIAILLEEGEDQAALEKYLAESDKKIDVSKKEKKQAAEQGSEQRPGQRPEQKKDLTIEDNKEIVSLERLRASPLAKRIAREKNIDIKLVNNATISGRRIVKNDVLNYLATNSRPAEKQQRQVPEYELIPNNNIRQVIAKKLTESKQTIPHFYLTIECKVDKLLSMRQEINAAIGEDKEKKISVNDFIIMAAAKAMKEVPAVNASWQETEIKQYKNIDIAVAVAIKDGLITPVIENADQRTIQEISVKMKNLAKKARDNALRPEEFQGGGFTISNLGMYGIKNFQAIINPPQSCILAIGASSKRAIVIDGQIQIGEMMDVTLSCDHRVVDGAVGAEFLRILQKYIEMPILLFV